MKINRPRLAVVMKFTDHHVVETVVRDLDRGVLPQKEFETLRGLFLAQLKEDPRSNQDAICQALAALLVGVAMSRLKMQKIAESN